VISLCRGNIVGEVALGAAAATSRIFALLHWRRCRHAGRKKKTAMLELENRCISGISARNVGAGAWRHLTYGTRA